MNAFQCVKSQKLPRRLFPYCRYPIISMIIFNISSMTRSGRSITMQLSTSTYPSISLFYMPISESLWGIFFTQWCLCRYICSYFANSSIIRLVIPLQLWALVYSSQKLLSNAFSSFFRTHGPVGKSGWIQWLHKMSCEFNTWLRHCEPNIWRI